MGIGQTWGENGDGASGGEREKGRQSGGGASSGEKEGWLGRGSRAEWREAGAHVGTPLLHPAPSHLPHQDPAGRGAVVTSTLRSTSLALQSVTGTLWVLSSYVGTAGSYP